jgi:hypothetical protein
MVVTIGAAQEPLTIFIADPPSSCSRRIAQACLAVTVAVLRATSPQRRTLHPKYPSPVSHQSLQKRKHAFGKFSNLPQILQQKLFRGVLKTKVGTDNWALFLWMSGLVRWRR